MKFIGGTHHGRDVPIALQVEIYSQRRQWIEVDEHAAPGERARRAERYRVVACRAADGGETRLLAREGLGRRAFESFAQRG